MNAAIITDVTASLAFVVVAVAVSFIVSTDAALAFFFPFAE